MSCCLATVRDDMALQGRDGESIQSLSRPETIPQEQPNRENRV